MNNLRCIKYTNRIWPQMGCAGRDGCLFRGPRELFWTGIHQHPYKCPNCGKNHTFLAINSLDHLKELAEITVHDDDLDIAFRIWDLPVNEAIPVIPDFG